MKQIDHVAHANRWSRENPWEIMVLSSALLAISIAAPPEGTAPLLAGVLWGLIRWVQVPPGLYMRLFLLPFGFLLVTLPALFVSVSSQGVQMQITPERGELALHLLLRSASATAVLVFMILTIPATRWMALFNSLGMPEWLADIVLLTYRMIFILADTLITGYRAQQARLGHETMDRRFRSIGTLVTSLFRRAFMQARRMERAMEARTLSDTVISRATLPPLRRQRVVLAVLLPVLTGGAGTVLSQWLQ
ncbi:MAG: cobalt ECF transporter T component CbiQ [Magnetococcales bacterium]|nr:cobalt ECF transporter T component CbiQ [Magnetococcales bacterium]